MKVRKSIAAALEIVGDLLVSHFVFSQPMTPLSVSLGLTIVAAVIVYVAGVGFENPMHEHTTPFDAL